MKYFSPMKVIQYHSKNLDSTVLLKYFWGRAWGLPLAVLAD